MYRCRRLIAAALSLAVIISFCVFSVFADDYNPVVEVAVGFQYGNSANGYSTVSYWGVDNSYAWQVAYEFWKIPGIHFYHLNKKCDVYFTFNMSFISDDPAAATKTDSSFLNAYGKKQGAWDYGSGEVVMYPGTHGSSSINVPEGYYLCNMGRTFICHFVLDPVSNGANYSDFSFSSAAQFYTTSPRIKIIPVFSDFRVSYDLYGALENLEQSLNLIDNRLYNIYNSTQDILAELGYIHSFYNSVNTELFDTYLWTQVSYDETTGQLVSNQASGNYFDALLGSIQSISSDAQQRSAMQEKASDAGADDALDAAYDGVGSSFGKLTDFSDLSDMGSWNGTSFSNQAEGGLLSWFSQACKDDIDTVPRTREPLDIIDVYTGHIEEYYAALGDDDDDPAD